MRGQYDEETPERQRFWDGMSSSINRFVPPEVRMEAGRLARLASRVHANLYGVGDIGGVQFGSGLYAQAGSLFNHSCASNATKVLLSDWLFLRAARDLKAGEVVEQLDLINPTSTLTLTLTLTPAQTWTLTQP